MFASKRKEKHVYLFIGVCVCMWVGSTCVTLDNMRESVLPFQHTIPEIRLRPSNLLASAFAHWAIPLPPSYIFC